MKVLCQHPSKKKGLVIKTHTFLSAARMRPSLKTQTQSLKGLKQTFKGSLITDVGEIFQGANFP